MTKRYRIIELHVNKYTKHKVITNLNINQVVATVNEY